MRSFRSALPAVFILACTTVALVFTGQARGEYPQVTAQGGIRSDAARAEAYQSDASRLAVSPSAVSPSGVSPLNVSRAEDSPVELRSPSGTFRIVAYPRATGDSSLRWDVEIHHAAGAMWKVNGIEASSFFLSDLPCLIALARYEANSAPCPLRVYDLAGRLIHEELIEAPTNPALSSDGSTFAWTTAGALRVLDLQSFITRTDAYLDRFAVGPNGAVAGVAFDQDVLQVTGTLGAPRSIALAPGTAMRTRKIALNPDGSAAFLLLPSALLRIELSSGFTRVLFNAPPFAELRDLSTAGREILVGTRRLEGDRFIGALTVLDADGLVQRTIQGPSQTIPVRSPESSTSGPSLPGSSERDARIAWPIAPDFQHPVGNTYGEYQNYGGAPYPHPGIDVLGSPGQPVFAVRRGVVKAILTTSGEWHWRVAVGDSAASTTETGYLYAHLDEPTIAVNVGDPIALGQYLGSLVEWPVANFTHCHFTQIEDSGATWDGVWLSVHNPHLDIAHQAEVDRPVFEPARGTDLLAFCANQTSTYQNANSLHGAVDIITHVGDRIASTWVCAVQELRYTIYPLGNPQQPLVNNKLSQFFDMTCDTYGSGQIDAFLMSLLYKDDSVCNTQGDYDFREFFHILTNSDGDSLYEQSDFNEAWNTSSLPDGDYVIRVTARDVRGNSASDSMVVHTVNGNTADAHGAPSADTGMLLERVWPNPIEDVGHVRFRLPTEDRILLTLHDAAGRQLRVLAEGRVGAGDHVVSWAPQAGAAESGTIASNSLGSGRGTDGTTGPGVYFLRLRGETLGTITRKVVVVR